MNPNNCATCDHIKHPGGGHCYMFRHEPQEVCHIHTVRALISISKCASKEELDAAALRPYQGGETDA